jgi:hypothetical protein
VGTVKKSTETRLRRWLSRKVRQVCDHGGLRWRTMYLDRGLREVDAQLLQFPVNPRCTPKGVGARQASDQRSDFTGNGRAAQPFPPAFPIPHQPEPGPMPADHGLGFDQGEGVSPAAPYSAEEN